MTSTQVHAEYGELDGVYFVVADPQGKVGGHFTIAKNLLGNNLGLAKLKFDSTTAPDTNVYVVLEQSGFPKEGEKYDPTPMVACKLSIKQNANDDSLVIKTVPFPEGRHQIFCDIVAGQAKKTHPDESNMEQKFRNVKEKSKRFWRNTFNGGKFEPLPGSEGAQ